jgi:GT2 family glycosyltransferase
MDKMIDMNKISIVIPTFGHYDLTHQLLFDLLKYNREADEILVLNDGSKDKDIHKGLEWWKSELLPQVKLIDFDENQGFLMTCNRGIPESKGDIIILCSNDVRLQDNIIGLVKNLFSNNPKLILGQTLYDTSTGWNEFKKGKKKVVFPYLDGSLLIFTKSAWEDIGGFDKIYQPYDFEDVDICTKAISCGYILKPMNNPKIHHIGAQTNTYGEVRRKITERNRKRFAKKWGVEAYDV